MSKRRSRSATRAKLGDSTSPQPRSQNKSPKSSTKQAKLPFSLNNKRVFAPENKVKTFEEFKLTEDEEDYLENMYQCQNYSDNQVIELCQYDIFGDNPEEIANEVIEYCKEKHNKHKLDFENVIFPFATLFQVLQPRQILVELRLSGCKILPSECQDIASNPVFRQLRSLDLSCNPIKLTGLLYLLNAEYSCLSNLRRLVLFSCKIKNSQLNEVPMKEFQAAKISLHQLNYLNISYNNLGNLGNSFVQKDFGLIEGRSLESLLMVECSLDDEFVLKSLINQLSRFINLFEVDISHNFFEESYQALMKGFQKHCNILTNINLVSNKFLTKPLADMTIQKISNQMGFIQLKRLDLSSSLKGDMQVQFIAESSAFVNLEYLKLRNCQITADGLLQLFESKHLRRLQYLLVPKNNIIQIKAPFNDMKDATELQIFRYTMKLQLLDIRQNPIKSSYLRYQMPKKFLIYAVILCENQQVMNSTLFTNISIQNRITDGTKEQKLNVNPLIIAYPNDKQKQFLSKI
ncbi:leucine-rich repeat-containing protein typical subtype [Stylonychia lemnae]|uniref:Leucine-rich repeat-containing protein typical subtype n=1 Tax=Stylonychia lemnae TaxID=5949 RepID=A0A077ZM35_STYLE|nr:leucine-rich repeat-containing protein typical subtype [Stylonychia lemnae]|eukprot:CDW71067.1 leucine-rich repeat-containing protein typical subtype [Stylonychia lemnae]